MSIISRSAPIANHEGRTLEGLAYRIDHPSSVTDNGRDFYLEAFTRGAATKSIKDRSGKFPLGILHPWSPGARTSPIPIGAVGFHESDEGLEFEAVISRTSAGDEALELVKDGALEDVSISCRPIRSARRGNVLYRTEIALRELSLAPTGMGQHEGAQVLAVRSEIEVAGTPLLDNRRRRARLVLL